MTFLLKAGEGSAEVKTEKLLEDDSELFISRVFKNVHTLWLNNFIFKK